MAENNQQLSETLKFKNFEKNEICQNLNQNDYQLPVFGSSTPQIPKVVAHKVQTSKFQIYTNEKNGNPKKAIKNEKASKSTEPELKINKDLFPQTSQASKIPTDPEKAPISEKTK